MSLKNWDNKTWLSSKNYIKSFNIFLLNKVKLNSNSYILDIGCGRGKILGSLSSKLRLKNKPIGIDIEIHKDRDKRISFKKIDAIRYLENNKNKFDLILIKQTIHLLDFRKIKRLVSKCKTKLKKRGKILIFTLETSKNENKKNIFNYPSVRPQTACSASRSGHARHTQAHVETRNIDFHWLFKQNRSRMQATMAARPPPGAKKPLRIR